MPRADDDRTTTGAALPTASPEPKTSATTRQTRLAFYTPLWRGPRTAMTGKRTRNRTFPTFDWLSGFVLLVGHSKASGRGFPLFVSKTRCSKWAVHGRCLCLIGRHVRESRVNCVVCARLSIAVQCELKRMLTQRNGERTKRKVCLMRIPTFETQTYAA